MDTRSHPILRITHMSGTFSVQWNNSLFQPVRALCRIQIPLQVILSGQKRSLLADITLIFIFSSLLFLFQPDLLLDVVSEICVASSNILASFTATRDVSIALSRIYSVDILVVSVLASVVPFHILMAAIVLSEILLTVLAYVSVMRFGEIQK